MDFDTIFSFFLYIGTFLLGIRLDFADQNKKIIRQIRWLFVAWLYIFFCFGYMTGSDWRGYELDFQNMSSFNDRQRLGESNLEMGFWSVFYILKILIGDFFLVIGVLKILYLYSTISVIKKLTDKWLCSMSILMPMSSCFMLIDNPLRFMVALVFINISLVYLIDNKKLKALFFILLSVLFHNTCILFLLLLPFLNGYKVILRFNNAIIFIAYLIVVYIFSGDTIVGQIAEQIKEQMLIMGGKNYSSYAETNSEAFFTLGSFINMVLMGGLLILRKDIVKMPNGELMFACSVVYFFFFRIFIFIPSGFRIAVPFTYFLAAAFGTVITKKINILLKTIVIVFFVLLLSRKILVGYVYLPYSNSIPYIITEHKPYNERSQYNFIEYKKRTGHEYSNE